MESARSEKSPGRPWRPSPTRARRGSAGDAVRAALRRGGQAGQHRARPAQFLQPAEETGVGVGCHRVEERVEAEIGRPGEGHRPGDVDQGYLDRAASPARSRCRGRCRSASSAPSTAPAGFRYSVITGAPVPGTPATTQSPLVAARPSATGTWAMILVPVFRFSRRTGVTGPAHRGRAPRRSRRARPRSSGCRSCPGSPPAAWSMPTCANRYSTSVSGRSLGDTATTLLVLECEPPRPSSCIGSGLPISRSSSRSRSGPGGRQVAVPDEYALTRPAAHQHDPQPGRGAPAALAPRTRLAAHS